MRVFNTGAGDFWRSRIGEQLRWLKLTTPSYHQARSAVVALVEQVARGVLPACRRTGRWPDINVRRGAVSFEWRGRGEIAVSLSDPKLSYTPDPIRKSNTIGMVLNISGRSPPVGRFLKGCLWHLLEVRP